MVQQSQGYGNQQNIQNENNYQYQNNLQNTQNVYQAEIQQGQQYPVNYQQQGPMFIVQQQPIQYQMIQRQNYAPFQLSSGSVQILCHTCGNQGFSRVEKKSCNVHCFMWTCCCGLLGLLGYLFACESAHGYEHYCYNCGALNYYKESECY